MYGIIKIPKPNQTTFGCLSAIVIINTPINATIKTPRKNSNIEIITG